MAHTLALPFRRDRHRAITLELFADDEGAERLAEELLAVARRFDPRAHAHVADAARDLPWPELSFVAVDVETTGFRPHVDRVIELAWVRFERGREVERFSTLLDAGVDVPDPVRALTGIVPAMLAGKPRFSEVAQGLVEALAGADFAVAYNAPFDRGFLATELHAAGRALPDVPWVDPLAFVRELGAERRTLAEAARRFGVEPAGAHRAENDARTTGRLLLALAPRLPAKTLAELVDTQQRWARLPVPEPDPPGFGARLLSLFR